jgi:hypothetical protein
MCDYLSETKRGLAIEIKNNGYILVGYLFRVSLRVIIHPEKLRLNQGVLL